MERYDLWPAAKRPPIIAQLLRYLSEFRAPLPPLRILEEFGKGALAHARRTGASESMSMRSLWFEDSAMRVYVRRTERPGLPDRDYDIAQDCPEIALEIGNVYFTDESSGRDSLIELLGALVLGATVDAVVVDPMNDPLLVSRLASSGWDVLGQPENHRLFRRTAASQRPRTKLQEFFALIEAAPPAGETASTPDQWWASTSEPDRMLLVAGSLVAPDSDQHRDLVELLLDDAEELLPEFERVHAEGPVLHTAVAAGRDWVAGGRQAEELFEVNVSTRLELASGELWEDAPMAVQGALEAIEDPITAYDFFSGTTRTLNAQKRASTCDAIRKKFPSLLVLMLTSHRTDIRTWALSAL